MNVFLADTNLYQGDIIQQTEIGPMPELSVSWVLFTTLFLCGVLIANLWFVKKWLNKEITLSRSVHRIQVLERKAVSQKTILYLIKVDGEKLLLSESQSQIDILYKGDIKPFVKSPAATPLKAGSSTPNKTHNPASDLSLR